MMKKKKKLQSSPKMEKLCYWLILFFILQMTLVLILKIRYYPPGSTATYIHPLYHHLQVVDHRKWKMATSADSLSLIQDKLPTDDPIQDTLKPPETITTSQTHRQNPINYLVQPEHLSDPITCDRSNPMYDWCHFKLPTILDPTTATLSISPDVVSTSSSQSLPPTTQKLRPYPRKADTSTMSNITEITLTTTTTSHSNCHFYHKSPALIFSIGGFTGNFFHDFNDGFIPLFVTINTHFSTPDINLVITDSTTNWWYDKYKLILPRFTNNPIINLHNHSTAHCFPSAVVGLITHGPMSVKPAHLPPSNRKDLLDFRSLLDDAYRDCPSWPVPKLKGRPRLLIVTRDGETGRTLLNQPDIITAAQEEGFDVVVFKPNPTTDLCQTYKLVNESQVMVGVHGSALTHSLFLRPRSVLIQVVPLGIDWLAQNYFGNLAIGIKLEYDEYNVKVEESTLAEKYEPGSRILTYPIAVASRNWSALNEIYLRGQDVRLDVGRFREYLKRAFFKAKKLMEDQGFNVRRRRGRMTRFVEPRVFT